MNRIANRSTIALILALVLIAGMCWFLIQVVMEGNDWAVFSGNPHVYQGSNIDCGQVVDRDGVLLLSATGDRVYSDDLDIRKSTIHWLGDRYGYISAPTVSYYAEELVGYDLLNGLYSYSGTGGEAVMTISAELQAVALEAMGDHRGTVAVYNYKTGEILCAVTTPTYDPDDVPDISGDTSGKYVGVYLNRFTQSTYTPGSIFKVVTTAAALECLEDARSLTFTCQGTYHMGVDRVTCTKSHGTIDLKTALAKSCNCYFAQLSEVLGAENLQAYADKLQVTQPLSFDGVTTAEGNFNIENAAAVELAWSAIGQHEDLVNPARFMTLMGVIAGGGEAAEPYIVSSISCDGSVTYRASVNSTGRLLDVETCQVLMELMRNNTVTVYGAEKFGDLTVCAKSGTAEVGGDALPNATFAGFVADEAYPLAFVVIVENGGAGSAVCVPVISRILAACRTYLDG